MFIVFKRRYHWADASLVIAALCLITILSFTLTFLAGPLQATELFAHAKLLWINPHTRAGPPVAEPRPTTTVLHNVSLVDDYAWLRWIDTDPAARRYLLEENDYAQSYLDKLAPLRENLASELLDQPRKDAISNGCLPKDANMSSFWEHGDFLYWTTFGDAGPHPIYKRRPLLNNLGCHFSTDIRNTSSVLSDELFEEVVLDLNTLLSPSVPYYYMGVVEVNPFLPNLLAYSIDLVGSERYTIRVRDINTGSDLQLPLIENTYYSARWLHDQDNHDAPHWLYFNIVDEFYGTPMSIQRICAWNCPESHTYALNRAPEVVFTEMDISFTTELSSSTDNVHVFIKVVGQVTSELHVILGSLHVGRIVCIFPRQPSIFYEADHYQGSLIIRTNSEDSPNFRIIKVLLSALLDDRVENTHVGYDVIMPHSPSRFVEKVEVLMHHMVVWFWKDGLRQLCLSDLQLSHMECKDVSFESSSHPDTLVYSLLPGTVSDIEARLFRSHTSMYFLYTRSSFLEPPTVFCVNLSSPDSVPIPIYQSSHPIVNFDQYSQRRLWIPIPHDGNNTLQMPVTILFRKDDEGEGAWPSQPRPTLIIAYGAYGDFQESGFSEDFFPLVDRGVLIAICHPRGDGDMGSAWHTDGKFENKGNTFTDTRRCLEGLVNAGYSKPGSIALKARSAGGLIAGNAISWKWETTDLMVKAVIAQVPFVDPIFDLLDESVPWTAFEWFEWGSPENYTIFKSMMQYSPYLNMQVGPQPAVLVTTGLTDPRVPFWEPAKFVAKLRTFKTNEEDRNRPQHRVNTSSPLLLRVYPAGHFSTMDETTRVNELVEWYSFLLHQILE
ncbi:hypothetical protein BASA50_003017 [Batrachochytrium salamandrivorans]|uniref:Prolyl endopeptidase n=1 Tax=Batrachochytrium salamandrivorans TaxID=1357716 RepID=A0ABQ8FJU0_9FUNG|nr:hypothetical protein BASA60_007764 [Batrachochytrium salamandrivorans]KAH6599506.1 hypothetical protein BASA50_003017 [Batrachochytrium salamandrivorans]KAH9277007.1 hypothetical protein BASA83_000524 [Batrachochytrium salamandrivorans]KAJ1344276.1 hypothetical protein BSLG_001416 [Batrachochytrium salamandrivorans]